MVSVVVVVLATVLSFTLFINDIEVPHHTGLMVLKNMAMVHPAARTIIRNPGYFSFGSRRKVNGIFPGLECWCFSIYLQNLEEEAMQMEGVVHQTCI